MSKIMSYTLRFWGKSIQKWPKTCWKSHFWSGIWPLLD